MQGKFKNAKMSLLNLGSRFDARCMLAPERMCCNLYPVITSPCVVLGGFTAERYS